MDSTNLPPEVPPAIARAARVWSAAADLPDFSRPLIGNLVPAGFPSPAEDYIEDELNILKLLVARPNATYFLRIAGHSLAGHWVRDGDIAVVDTSIEPKAGMVVIAVLDGEVVAKQLGYGPNGEVLLVPSNRHYKTLVVHEEQDFFIWAVVTWTIHRQFP